MNRYRDLVLALREMKVDGSRPVMAHASLSAFGYVKGGAEAVLGALLYHFETVLMPTFTYRTMVVPDDGPEDNAMRYGSMTDSNKMAQMYHPQMPADPLMGIIPETLRQHEDATRSKHPILSFSGVNAESILELQTLKRPLAPVAALADMNGWVLLLGVGHKANTSIHLGERLGGRKTFTRWALVPDMALECPRFPSCSDGFDALAPLMEPFAKQAQVGEALVQAFPMPEMVETVRQLVQADPLALLCENPECPRCNTVRASA